MTSTLMRELTKKRNIRSLLFRLSEATVQRELLHQNAAKTFQALKIHGFRLGMISDVSYDEINNQVKDQFDALHFGTEVADITVYERMAQALQIPLSRTAIITDASKHDTSFKDLAIHHDIVPMYLTSEKPSISQNETIANFAQDLLGFEQSLDTTGRCFGPYRVQFSQIFYESPLSFALVNLKPIVPGHVLVIPKRCVDRFGMLDPDEVSDLWCTAQLVGKRIEDHYGASSLTFAIQDGSAAGQTVEHVHIHVLPRFHQDFERNDDIYTHIENHERQLHVDNEKRTPRSEAEMFAEADHLRQLLI